MRLPASVYDSKTICAHKQVCTFKWYALYFRGVLIEGGVPLYIAWQTFTWCRFQTVHSACIWQKVGENSHQNLFQVVHVFMQLVTMFSWTAWLLLYCHSCTFACIAENWWGVGHWLEQAAWLVASGRGCSVDEGCPSCQEGEREFNEED